MIKPTRCKSCLAFIGMDDEGWLFPHYEKGLRSGDICMCREPLPPSADEYTVGFDHDPWVASAGLPTLGKKR